MLTLDLHAVAHEQLDDARRRARDGTQVAHHQPAQVHGVQAVDVLLGVDGQ